MGDATAGCGRGPRKQLGLTLMELLMGLVITAIVLSLAVPSFNSMLTSSRMSAHVMDLVAAHTIARNEAAGRKRIVHLCASDSAESSSPACNAAKTWTDGWLSFVDLDADGVRDAGETIIAAHGKLHGLSVKSSTVVALSYRSDGSTDLSNDIVLCGTLDSSHDRRILVSRTGVVRTVENSSLCP